jgi:hypothetical protein
VIAVCRIECSFASPITAPTGQRQSQFHFTELNSQLAFVQKSPLLPFFKGGKKMSPFAKGDLEGFLVWLKRL